VGAAGQKHPQAPAQPLRVAFAGLLAPDLAAILITVLVWSSLHPIAKRTLTEITPSQLPFSRVALASIFLIGVCLVTGRLGRLIALFLPRHLWKVVVLGTTGFSLSSGSRCSRSATCRPVSIAPWPTPAR
jgi:hypothetical protein